MSNKSEEWLTVTLSWIGLLFYPLLMAFRLPFFNILPFASVALASLALLVLIRHHTFYFKLGANGVVSIALLLLFLNSAWPSFILILCQLFIVNAGFNKQLVRTQSLYTYFFLPLFLEFAWILTVNDLSWQKIIIAMILIAILVIPKRYWWMLLLISFFIILAALTSIFSWLMASIILALAWLNFIVNFLPLTPVWHKIGSLGLAMVTIGILYYL